MKNLVLLFLTLLPYYLFSQNSGNHYSQAIYVDEALKDEIAKKSIEDLSYFLGKATGKSFKIITTRQPSSKGINIFLLQHAGVDASIQKQFTNSSIESFLLNGTKDKLDVIAIHPKGISLGIYSYLDTLGFRWYMPGETWTYIPALKDIAVVSKRFAVPSFRIRSFFGTGGIIPVKTIDPKSDLQTMWDEWARRNRLGGETQLKGHYGEWFNMQHRKELEFHPEYMAMINGKRVAWSESAKWCISNSTFRELYIKDRMDEAKESLSKKNFTNEIITVTSDPSDGGGDCQCEVCKKMGSPSDRTFFLANETAKALQKIGNNIYVNLYAYNTHVVPPRFSLAANLIVQVIPYAFQTYAAPGQMIEDWKKKSSNIFIYDYYGVTDWHYNLPMSNRWSADTLVDRLRYWKEKNIQGFMLESSYSIGSVGMALFLSARLGWNTKVNVDVEKQDFFKKMFGSSAAGVKEYFQQTAYGFGGLSDVIYLQNKLSKERQYQKDVHVVSRILQLQAYLHYLLLYYEWSVSSPETSEAKWQKLMLNVWQVYHTGLIQSTRIAELLIWHSNLPDTKTKLWNPYVADAQNLQHINKLKENDLEEIVEQDVKSNPLLTDFAYVQQQAKKYSYSLKPSVLNGEQPDEEMLILVFPETYIHPSKELKSEFYIKVNIGSQNNTNQNITVEAVDTATNKIAYISSVAIDSGWKRIQLKLPADKIYKLIIRNSFWIRLRVPKNQWFGIANIPTHAVLGKLWFWMPSESRYFYYSNNSKEQPIFINASGQSLKAEKISENQMYRLDVPQDQRGKWWSIGGTEYQFIQFYRKPDIFFLHPNYEMQINR